MTYSSESDMYPEVDEISEEEEEEEQSSSEPDLEQHQEYREVYKPVVRPTTVMEAIHTAKSDRIYTLLLEMVTTIPAAKAFAEQRLLRPASDSVSRAQPALKRKAYETCKNCNEEYSVDNNHKGDCVYHEGEKEVSDHNDFWADHDWRCHGEPKDFVDDPDYEDGFIWNCCHEEASAAGCIVSRHEPEESSSSSFKRARPILPPVSRSVHAYTR